VTDPIREAVEQIKAELLPETDEFSAGWNAASYQAIDNVTAALSGVTVVPPGSGIERIAVERQRQIEREGFTVEHDAHHDPLDLVEAALSYMLAAETPERWTFGAKPPRWPWSAATWKPSRGPARNLEKAGALIAAVLDRLAASTSSEEPTVRYATAEELRARRSELIESTGLGYDVLAQRADTYQLSPEQESAWDTIRGLDYLLGDRDDLEPER